MAGWNNSYFRYNLSNDWKPHGYEFVALTTDNEKMSFWNYSQIETNIWPLGRLIDLGQVTRILVTPITLSNVYWSQWINIQVTDTLQMSSWTYSQKTIAETWWNLEVLQVRSLANDYHTWKSWAEIVLTAAGA